MDATHWTRRSRRRPQIRHFALQWAEQFWAESDPKGILNGPHCGLAHYVPALWGRFGGSWRLYKAWGRCGRPKQALPVPEAVMRALARRFEKQSHRGAATMIVVALHHILRSNEFMAMVGADVVVESGHLLVILRNTKTGQRLGIVREIAI